MITGATGRTGRLVLQKLRDRSDELKAIKGARSPQKVSELFGSTEGFVIGDIKDKSSLDSALSGCDALVILTSAVPKMVTPPSEGCAQKQLVMSTRRSLSTNNSQKRESQKENASSNANYYFEAN